MKIVPLLLKEIGQEAQITRKFLKLVSPDNFDWKPHTKSMNMKDLSVHIAELPSWVAMALTTDGLDFATAPNEPKSVNSTEDLLKILDNSYASAKNALENAKEEDLLPTWTLKNDGHVIQEFTKYEAIRHSIGHVAHHRSQLGMYLRLLDIPIPGSYGPSADEMS